MADGRKNNGGAGRGQGRKAKADEDKVRNLAIKAIQNKYGSESKGFKALLESGEPSLIKFVYEHAYGKPKDKLEHSTPPGSPLQNEHKHIVEFRDFTTNGKSKV